MMILLITDMMSVKLISLWHLILTDRLIPFYKIKAMFSHMMKRQKNKYLCLCLSNHHAI